ncbi:uncharacterized protein LOC115625404 [Scaptodrosophila lebanonensis]|uniref:Uncharacterized protein LOC115625404 n=1 Tax=Drosophila lebanonensis TaxID=7225 RepID=A0A6J2TMS9_DROLE|nr:uncharacterized protein LOC115625404 [Scaptodrosophila lebanonensis]
MQKCYCGQSSRNSSSGILRSTLTNRQQQQQRRGSSSTLTSSQQSARSTQFIKLPKSTKRGSAVDLGLGHSQSQLGNNFCRRSSTATTVSHCSSCCSSCSTAQQQKQRQQQQQQSRVKVLRWGSERMGLEGSDSGNGCEHTDNRRLYEQRACAAMSSEGQRLSHGQGQGKGLAGASTMLAAELGRDELQRLLALQQFRLLNATECFSVERQDELRLQGAYDRIGTRTNDTELQSNKWLKNKANESRLQSTKSNTKTTPYALRQKMLQLRLQEEQKLYRDGVSHCAPLDKSCALRFNCK